MRRGWGLPPRALLLLLVQVTLPGDGNEGSVAGSCHCSKTLSSDFHAGKRFMEHFRKYGKIYHRCPLYIRFELRSQSVCGDSRDQWVLEVMSCFDSGECGHAYREKVVHQKHLSPHGTPIPRPTEGEPPDRSTPPQKYPPSASKSTPKPTRLPGTLSLDKGLSHFSETTTPTVGYSLETGHQAKENQKDLKEKASATGGPSSLVPVLSLLGIVFFLIGIISYMKCRRNREQPQQYTQAVTAYV
ncbi:C-X-C motif chemokine 16 [Octodon degus]|uniref:C-X-C motif chemokine 16 n=1 Tax=Octodon degus TaxID=10160 RepID=A0A6P6F3M0_OCTDE|nr:C-X-C motif chemokine 16 [Octodon degus]